MIGSILFASCVADTMRTQQWYINQRKHMGHEQGIVPFGQSQIGWAAFYNVREPMPWHNGYEIFDSKEEAVEACLQDLHRKSEYHALRKISFVEKKDSDGSGSFGYKAEIC